MPVEIYVTDWLNLVLRWAHIITAIAWIGSSFYFIWLDARLNVPPRDPENDRVGGDLWAIHGGGFYHSQKYTVAPAQLPEPLHWFKWEAYSTWITGFLLLVVVYYLNADAFLIDPQVARIDAATAIGVSLSLLPLGWLVYNALCRLPLRSELFAALGVLTVLGLAWALSHLFSGRGMFMQVGVMLGSIMVANVFRVIIPSQRQLVAARGAGAEPDPALGQRAKRRSVHNNYLTLPVVFVMISPHFPMTYTHPYNWLVLVVIFLAGALVRHYFNLRNRGRKVPALAVLSLLILASVAALIAPRPPDARGASSADRPVGFAEVQHIIQTRCVTCHSSTPTHPAAPVTAAGVAFDSPREIDAWAARIFDRAVVSRTMPLANLTGMTDQEREILGRWYADGASTD